MSQFEKKSALPRGDRVALLPYLDRACRNYVLRNPQFVTLLSINGISVDEVCRCQGPLFISHLNDDQVKLLTRHGLGVTTTAFMNNSFVQAVQNCGLSLTALRLRESTQ